jgi:hypothetical protein
MTEPQITPLSVVPAIEGVSTPPLAIPYFIASKNGWITNSPTLFGSAQVKTFQTPTTLEEVKERFYRNENKIPAHILTQAHHFFRMVYAKIKTESSVYICYNDNDGTYHLYVPEQYVTHGSVNHRLPAGAIESSVGAGYRAIGTIHSHCNFSAFHSATDRHDMDGMPGLHITIGHVDREEPEMVFALSVNKAKFDVERADIVDEEKTADRNGYSTAPEWWMNYVHEGQAPWGHTGVTTRYGTHRQPVKSKAPKKTTPAHASHRSRGGHMLPSGQMSDPYGYDGWGHYDENSGLYMSPSTAKRMQNYKDAFKENELEISMAEDEMEALAIALAMKGFHLNFSITHQPQRAEAYLARQGIQMVLPEEGI